jgi:hypothetical protein
VEVEADRVIWTLVVGFAVLVPIAPVIVLLWVLLHRDLKTLRYRGAGVRPLSRVCARGFEVKQIPGTTPGAEEKDIDHG